MILHFISSGFSFFLQEHALIVHLSQTYQSIAFFSNHPIFMYFCRLWPSVLTTPYHKKSTKSDARFDSQDIIISSKTELVLSLYLIYKPSRFLISILFLFICMQIYLLNFSLVIIICLVFCFCTHNVCAVCVLVFSWKYLLVDIMYYKTTSLDSFYY